MNLRGVQFWDLPGRGADTPDAELELPEHAQKATAAAGGPGLPSGAEPLADPEPPGALFAPATAWTDPSNNSLIVTLSSPNTSSRPYPQSTPHQGLQTPKSLNTTPSHVCPISANARSPL